jgi:hypothetical protein
MNLKHFEEQIFFAVVRIVTPNAGGSGDSVGTGFLYVTPLPDFPDRSITLLISNRHVLKNPSGAITLVFHKKDPEVESMPKLGETVIVTDKSYEGVFCAHPDSNVDLACVNISNVTHPEHKVFYKSLTQEMLPSFSEERLVPGVDVYFVGYPENRFDVKHNLPIMRRGFVASIPKVDFNGRSEFLIDAQVFPGSSGSPVFTPLDGQFKLIGVVSQTMIRNAQIQAVPTAQAYEVQQILGLGIVIKTARVRELVEAAIQKVTAVIRTQEASKSKRREPENA